MSTEVAVFHRPFAVIAADINVSGGNAAYAHLVEAREEQLFGMGGQRRAEPIWLRGRPARWITAQLVRVCAVAIRHADR
jgi:hypothetical protein